MVMSRDQNAGGSHTIKIDNSSFERVEKFKCLGTNLTDENSVQEENKSSLKMENACRCRIFVFQFAIQKYEY